CAREGYGSSFFSLDVW
nr:immunoglobulin heavy chain junction region [Macaca mulatta]MOV47423.1 immunoglobulin heavy chain junction region [Macaca mulatta]MOV47559.1 immunoglobulin heavy chain junction region [Macaca mulatta]MOV47658.1 immunoglobulin heavy chain junction region [Macaca mulatta]MOV47691.1 immunoglobulin heavy chain junction region [Macaca mulatta]